MTTDRPPAVLLNMSTNEPWIRDQVESWVADFVHGVAGGHIDPLLRPHAEPLLVAFLDRACAARGVAPGDVERADLKQALLGLPLALDDAARARVPRLCADFLTDLELRGRLADGEALGQFVAALRDSHLQTTRKSPAPLERPGSKLGRNDPCPCGSGLKYKKCCMKALDD
ncbi:MAG: SEC-C metal-binding domain-containing protein [Planctomycetota bacterium]